MTRLTDLLREQSSQNALGPDAKNPIHSVAPTGLPVSLSTPASSVPEINWYQRACQELQGIKRAVQARQPWSVDEMARIASGIVAAIGAHDKLIQTVLQHEAGDYLIKNAVNVAIVSVKIAEALRYEPAKLERVALAGLLHDIGMFALPDSLLYKTGTLTAEERKQMKEHPQHGAHVFKEAGDVYPWVGTVILQEHERWDGSGYPRQLSGKQIDEVALIIGLADVFDALMSVRPNRSGGSPHRAIRTLLAECKTVFPHHLLKALIDQLSIYPLGTAVRLNTGETGVVFQLNRQYPLRPILQISQQALSGQSPLSKTVDLRADTSLHIVEVMPIGALSVDPR
ncbi:MAG: HD-GYP domain-containing protein [Nitrospirota bacterium]|nr:HD-GYP domain-containing protein [Nitrospirota bacterium]MDP2383422.1 HD-GYP domain-containing protein [Nitrospirota bacterium]